MDIADRTAASAANSALERVARDDRARIIAILAASSRDLALAEDAFADAAERALRTWPGSGVPVRPSAWIFTVARNRMRDLLTSGDRRFRADLDPDDGALPAVPGVDPDALDAVPDRRLELLYACAHPALDPTVRTPLMLQVVLGLDARALATLFATSQDAIAQRLVRAKRRIRDAGIPFHIPDPAERPARLRAVLEAVYGAASAATVGDDLLDEACFLATLVVELEPGEPEALALAALLEYSAAWNRRRSAADEYVPLDDQDPATWSVDRIARAERLLTAAHAHGRPGRFQYEAAILSTVAARSTGREPEPGVVVRLHRALVGVAPTLGSRTALAAALGRAGAAGAGLAELDALGPDAASFAPHWATRARLLADVGNLPDARDAYERAGALTVDEGVRRWLASRRDAIG